AVATDPALQVHTATRAPGWVAALLLSRHSVTLGPVFQPNAMRHGPRRQTDTPPLPHRTDHHQVCHRLPTARPNTTRWPVASPPAGWLAGFPSYWRTSGWTRQCPSGCPGTGA